MRNTNDVYAGALLVSVAGIAAGCSLVAGLEPAQLEEADAGTGGSAATGGMSSGSSGSATASTSGITSSSASGASSSSGSGGAQTCTPGATSNCYDGAAATSGVGLCKGGQQTCNATGTALGQCAGEVVPIQETCASGLDQNCDGFKCALWAELFDNAVAGGVALDSKGNIFVVGYFNGVSKFGNAATLISFGGKDIFIAKLDPTGTPVWATQFGDPSDQAATAVAVDSSGNVILGAVSGTGISLGGPTLSAGLVAAKFTNDGTLVWSKGLGADGDGMLNSIATTLSGDVVVGGSTLGAPLNFGDGAIAPVGNQDAFVAKLRASDGSGKVSDGFWGHTYGTANSYAGTRMLAIDAAGSVIFAGVFTGTFNLGKGPMTAVGFNGDFLGKLTAAGAPSWQTQFAESTAQSAAFTRGLIVDAMGGPIIAGAYQGGVNFGSGMVTANGTQNGFVAHFDSSGNPLWDTEFAASSAGFNTSAISPSGDVVITGGFQGTLNLGGSPLTASASGDGFLAKFKSGAAAPTFEWNQQFVGLNGFPFVAEMPTGESVIAGSITQTTDFGTGPLSPVANGSLFVAKFNP